MRTGTHRQYGPDGAVLKLLRTLHLSSAFILAATRELARGQREAAQRALALAEKESLRALHLLAASEELTAPQRDEFQQELDDLAGVLATLNGQINHRYVVLAGDYEHACAGLN
jgi:hypothetical protein